jgi:prefoldin subunit 5
MGGKTSKFSAVFLTAVLVIGIIVGYGVNYIITSPKIGSLTEEIEYKNNQITSLQTTVGMLEDNITSLRVSLTDLTELYDDLAENTVPKSQYDALATEHQELTADYDTLEARLLSLESIIEELIEENQELSDEYEELLVKYTEIRVLSWTYFESHGLTVNLTTTATTYDENKPIIGSVSIFHEDDQPFNGTISLILWSDYFSSGTASGTFSVYGKTNYSFPHPFILGPGTYCLRVLEIRDANGNMVITSAEAREYSIKITMG